MGYITEQELSKDIVEKLNKPKQSSDNINIDKIVDSDGESIKEKLKKVTLQYEEFKKETNTIKDTKSNKKYKWGVENGLVYIEEVED